MVDQYPLKKRSDLHLTRKIWHICGVLGMVGIHHFLTQDQCLRVLSVVAFLAVTFDVCRHQLPFLNKIALRIFGPVMREYERTGLAGTTHLLLGTFVIVLLFPRPIVSLTLLFLAVADPLASYFGILYGKDKLIGSKSLQGSLAAFVSCALIAVVYFLVHHLMTERLILVSLMSGLIGAASELLPVGRLDDNFTFPIVSASLLWLMFQIFGGL